MFVYLIISLLACGCGRTELNIELFSGGGELERFHCCWIFFLNEGLEDLNSLSYSRHLKQPGGFLTGSVLLSEKKKAAL